MSRLDISDSSPKGVALLMCERCETTPDGRRHVHGIFEHIITPVFPLKVTRFFVYIGVSGSGTEDFTLRLTGQDGSVITDGAFRVSDWGLAGVCEFSLAFLDVVFAKPGRYSLRLSGRGWVVDRTRPSARRKALNQRTRYNADVKKILASKPGNKKWANSHRYLTTTSHHVPSDEPNLK